MSFLYDINITRSEDNGIAYIKKAMPLMEKFPEYFLHQYYGEVFFENNGVKEKNIHDVSSSIDDVFFKLKQGFSLVEKRLMYMPESNEAKKIVKQNLNHLENAWIDIRDFGSSPDKCRKLMNRLIIFFVSVGDASMLNLEPVLDGNYLSDVAVKGIPLYIQKLMEILACTGGSFDDNGKFILERLDINRIYDFTVILENISEDHIERSSEIAIREDENYYGISPGLHEKYAAYLMNFVESKSIFCNILRDILKHTKESTPHEFMKNWNDAHLSAVILHRSAVEELHNLIENRRNSYMKWRLYSFITSTAALLLAGILVFTISRGIINSVSAITKYAEQVSQGEYDAPIEGNFSGEFEILSTDIQKMVAELKLRLAYTEGILDSIVAPFVVTDENDDITFANTAVMSLLDKNDRPDNALGQNIHSFFNHTETIKRLYSNCLIDRICMENEEAVLTGKDGALKYVNVFISPLYNQDGRLIGSSTFIVDLTDLKNREKEIDRLAAFPRQNPSPVMAGDKNGDIYYQNPATRQVLERLNLSISDFLPGKHKEITALCLTSGRIRKGIETEIKDKVYAWMYHPIPKHDNIHIYVTDITERKELERQLLHGAFHDDLTGLPNRALLLDRLNQLLSHVMKTGDDVFSILYLDFDRFKIINDSLGHSVGDVLLKKLSARVSGVLNNEDTLARFGGDEFIILLGTSDITGAIQRAEKILEVISEPIIIEGFEFSMTASIGITGYKPGRDSAEELLRDADTAMHRAKALGKNRYELFDEEMYNTAKKRLKLEIEMKHALNENQFTVYYQPIICIKTGRLSGFEALVRWIHPEKGIVSPADFIPMAEETGLIIPLGLFVLEQACRKGREWLERHPEIECFMMSVNLSVKQFSSETLVPDIRAVLERTGFPPELLKLEITESGIMENAAKALYLLKELEDMQLKLSIDDFGTGYSSLSYLTRFPFHFLKVDQSFVRGLENEPENLSIVKTIVSLAHDMNKEVIAEGIETLYHYKTLKGLNAEFAQGYYFSKPIPVNEVELLLKENPVWSVTP